MPISGDALQLYQRDVLAELRRLEADVQKAKDALVAKLAAHQVKIDKLKEAGEALREYGIDDDTAEPINHDAEEMLSAIDNGLFRDLDDYAQQVTENFDPLLEVIEERISDLEFVVIPPGALIRVERPKDDGDEDE